MRLASVDNKSHNYSVLSDRLRTGGVDKLHELLAAKQEETLWLDFKGKDFPDRPGLTDADKKNLGKTLSGFSNSDGRLLIWGVDARKDLDNIDCAQELFPVRNVRQFERDVANLLPTSLTPVNSDVELLAISEREASD